jgi:uncharacterized membrane protein
MNRKQRITGLALIATGLSAGVFYTFSTAINPAFAALSDQNYILAMQHINRDIQNPVFFLSFFGAAFLLPWAAKAYRGTDTRRFKLLVAASAIYIVGVFGVTSAANVPLNDTLDKVPAQTATAAQLHDARQAYVGPWNAWHMVRTVSGVAALVLVSTAAIVPEKTRK